MMQRISRKSTIKEITNNCLFTYSKKGTIALVNEIHKTILSHKIKFPLLEYCGQLLYEELQEKDRILFCDEIEKLKTIGGNVLLGIFLQIRLASNFKEAIEKATEYISMADAWYVCDIIGERVYGYSLLMNPKKTFPEYKYLIKHESQWVVRSLGAGSHFAIKKGLAKQHVMQLFQLLLSMANSKNKEIKQGMGWAVKTTAKFHPDIITQYRDRIENKEMVGQWFRGKIKIGLERNQYAQRD